MSWTVRCASVAECAKVYRALDRRQPLNNEGGAFPPRARVMIFQRRWLLLFFLGTGFFLASGLLPGLRWAGIDWAIGLVALALLDWALLPSTFAFDVYREVDERLALDTPAPHRTARFPTGGVSKRPAPSPLHPPCSSLEPANGNLSPSSQPPWRLRLCQHHRAALRPAGARRASALHTGCPGR
ncbi:hypothetical protein [Chthonomonas calidirosea]|uniref:hypothetical protein n=1 Tax=Chthonomonas calidirosea TaxID=454171 RepID=UPI00155AD255|nr:hypothetical protein [Chthonomonas calidirosea]